MSTQVHNIGTEHLHRTWFLVNGQIDEIDMREWDITSALQVAAQIGAMYFWRRLSQNMEDMSWNWGCYRRSIKTAISWRGQKIEPFKIVRSPDSSAAEMICRTLEAMQ